MIYMLLYEITTNDGERWYCDNDPQLGRFESNTGLAVKQSFLNDHKTTEDYEFKEILTSEENNIFKYEINETKLPAITDNNILKIVDYREKLTAPGIQLNVNSLSTINGDKETSEQISRIYYVLSK